MLCPLPSARRSAQIRQIRWPAASRCGRPDPEALAIIGRGAARIVTVSEAEIRRAMRILFSDTHNVAEGAGAAALAAALQERSRLAGRRVAIIQSGGNIDRALFAEILAEDDSE